MTTTASPPSAATALAAPDVLGRAVVAGVALGVLDLILQLTLPYPWANMANSSAVWAGCAAALAVVLRTSPARSAVAGAVMLVVAVQAYYVAAIVLNLAGLGALWAPRSVMWTVFGVVSGVVFGAAGSWAVSLTDWPAAAAAATVSAVFFAEIGVRVWAGAHALGDATTTVLTLLAGAVAIVALVRSGRSPDHPRQLARAVILALPLTVLGTVALRISGFGG